MYVCTGMYEGMSLGNALFYLSVITWCVVPYMYVCHVCRTRMYVCEASCMYTCMYVCTCMYLEGMYVCAHTYVHV